MELSQKIPGFCWPMGFAGQLTVNQGVAAVCSAHPTAGYGKLGDLKRRGDGFVCSI